ncbi:MAG: hypothetical protein P8Y01_08000, partial [Woeseiaceae bacterium]
PWVQKSLDSLADLMPGRYAKDETSEGYVGAMEMYAYRMPVAPPDPVEPTDGIDVSKTEDGDDGDRRVVVSSAEEATP